MMDADAIVAIMDADAVQPLVMQNWLSVLYVGADWAWGQGHTVW